MATAALTGKIRWTEHPGSMLIIIEVYLYSAFHDTNLCKAALQKMLSFYIIFRSRLLVVTMAEMYSKNHAVSYKLHVIKQTVNTINNDCMLRLNVAIKHDLVVLYVVWGLASSEVFWGVGIISSQVFGHLRSFKGWIQTEVSVISICLWMRVPWQKQRSK